MENNEIVVYEARGTVDGYDEQMYAVFEHADFRHEPFKSKIREQNRELRKRNRRLRRYPLSITQKARLAINAVSPYYTWRIMGF